MIAIERIYHRFDMIAIIESELQLLIRLDNYFSVVVKISKIWTIIRSHTKIHERGSDELLENKVLKVIASSKSF